MGTTTTRRSITITPANRMRKRPKNAGVPIGTALIEALGQALEFKSGADTGATVRIVTTRRAKAEPAPRYPSARVARLRKHLKLSQPLFAEALNVSSAAVKAWEQGINEPSGAALRLLQIAESYPEVILEGLSAR